MLIGLMLILAASPPAARANELATSESWDDLYLAFSAVKPAGYSQADQKAIGRALERGCEKLEPQDSVMAYSLGDKAAQFDPTAAALLCVARSGQKSEQRDSSEKALRAGLARYPKDARFPLLLGRQLLEDHDAAGARTVLRAIGRKTPEFAEAQALLQRANNELSADLTARQQARAIERRFNGAPPDPEPEGARGETIVVVSPSGRPESDSPSASEEGPDGMRIKTDRHFTMKYFKHERDFAQRSDYEGEIRAALDEAYSTAGRILGRTREKSTDVVLYTREEFAAHFSAAFARHVAGLYALDAIRINGGEQLDTQQKAVLVHEYVHAVVDEVSGFQSPRLPTWLNEGLAEYVEWRYLGNDGPPFGAGVLLKQAARSSTLPQLTQMDRGMLIGSSNPGLAYAFSAMAVKRLFDSGGAASLLGLIRDVGAGTPFETALTQRYGRNVAALQADAALEVSGT